MTRQTPRVRALAFWWVPSSNKCFSTLKNLRLLRRRFRISDTFFIYANFEIYLSGWRKCKTQKDTIGFPLSATECYLTWKILGNSDFTFLQLPQTPQTSKINWIWFGLHVQQFPARDNMHTWTYIPTRVPYYSHKLLSFCYFR